MRTPSPSRLLLFALLAFQLAFGLQQQSVGSPALHARAMHHAAASAAANGACPLHATPTTDDKHDCCKAACQCQCGYLPLTVGLAGPKGIPASAWIQPIIAVRIAAAPPGTLFRPPIKA